ncbi:MAG: hypothetical protein COB51_05805 [Moraxellaceae bacterium]|nr:MAG: hypothetical protein COB51_05805 [Moraxellaceae bacterium]
MNIILINPRNGRSHTLALSPLTYGLTLIALLCIPIAAGYAAYHWSSIVSPTLSKKTAQIWGQKLNIQKAQLSQVMQENDEKMTALTLSVVQMEARLLRLDALGEHLTEVANLRKGEFDFGLPPAMGGPAGGDLGDTYQRLDFMKALDQLMMEIEGKEQQLEVLDSLLANRRIQDDVFLAGRPIDRGWMSSRYGRRTDPFTGRLAWHKGVDFAGKMNSPINAVASGVVTWSGDRHGYGEMVEINHGGGYSTRYAHNTENLVNVGDIVRKGQDIALMGSSGRSTGPHVHFEVFKDGRAVDPAKYIYRSHR